MTNPLSAPSPLRTSSLSTKTVLPTGSPKTTRLFTKLSLIGLLVSLLIILAVTKVVQIMGHIEEGKKKGPPPTTVSTLIVHATSWQPNLSLVTSLSAAEGAMLSAETAGVIASIPAEDGALVEAGTLLLELDTTVERAELTAAEARTWEAKKALDRASFLAPRQASSRSELDQAEATFRARKAEAAAIEAKIARKQIRAPFRGRLGIRQVNMGAYVSPGTPIIPLYQLDTVFADFSVPQDKVGAISVGQPVSMTLGTNGRAVTAGTISAIDPQVDPASRLLSVRATFPNADHRLRPGMFGTVLVPLGDPTPVFPVPETAIAFAPYGNSVFVLKEEPKGSPPASSLEQRFITLGERRGDVIAVTAGLSEGERIVSAGTFRLRSGMSVYIDDSLQPSSNEQPTPPRS